MAQFRPRPIKQLRTGASTFAMDCGVASTLVLLQFASRQEVDPRSRKQKKWWIAFIRETMGVPSGMTNARHVDAFFGSDVMDFKFRSRYRLLPSDFKVFLGGPIAQMEERVANLGRAALVAIRLDQGFVRQHPDLSSHDSSNFNHGVVWIRRKVEGGQKLDLIYDPLYDGRILPSGRQAPTVPTWWPHRLLVERAAAVVKNDAGDLTGDGNVFGGTIRRGQVLEVDGPVPGPPFPAPPEPAPADDPEPPPDDPNEPDDDDPADGDPEQGMGEDEDAGFAEPDDDPSDFGAAEG
jgi:hypothetical protein